MSFVLSSLSAYTKQNIKPLLTSAVFGAKTQELIKSAGILIPGVKSSTAIPLLDTDAPFQLDNQCAFEPSGNTTITQRTITVGRIKIEERLCPKDLEVYFTQEALKAGSTYENFGNADWQSVYLAKRNARIASQLETALWQGDTTLANINLKQFDGLSKQIVAGSPIDANVSGFTGVATITTITASNVIAATEGIYKAIPVAVLQKGDVKIFVGNDWYRLLIMAYRALNLFSYNPQDATAQSFILPATNIEIMAVNGLNGTGDAFAISMANMVMAVDLSAEEENYDMWWSRDNNDVRFRVAFKMGVNVAFTTECVKFIAAI
jgi:hypothetical protein